MSAKKPKPTTDPAKAPANSAKRSFDARNGLGVYIERPETNPEGLVVEYDDDFVVVNDKFPKARYSRPCPCPDEDQLLTPIAYISSSFHATPHTTTNTLSASSRATLPSSQKYGNASTASKYLPPRSCVASMVATVHQTRHTSPPSKS